MVRDEFDGSQLSPHWRAYDGPYGSGVRNCATPSHATVSGGSLHLRMAHEDGGTCGAAWYTGGVALVGFSAIDQRVTVRFRVVQDGATSHRIIPMRWPDDDASWPAAGEEDYCEGEQFAGCDAFLHYAADNQQVSGSYPVDLAQWHTLQTTRVDHQVTVTVDGTVAWSYAGSAATLPDTVKHVVLQQECPPTGCPAGTIGSEDIQVDWISVDAVATSQSPQPIDHVFVVVEENHAFDQVIGSADAPYLNSLAGEGVLATDYHGITYPSLPNYLALVGGDTFGITADCAPADVGCTIDAPNLADRLEAQGRTWRGYFDGMAAPCGLTSAGTYRVNHDPFVYFADIGTNPSRCAAGVRPIADLASDLAADSTTPSLAFIVPDRCHDMHDCPVATGDEWLRAVLPPIFDSPAWTGGRSVLVITFDEDDGLSQNRVATVLLGPSVVPHGRLGGTTDHYRLLRTLEDAWALPPLAANDEAALPMTVFRREASPDLTPPSAPPGFTGVGVSPSEIHLTWAASSDDTGVDGYELYRDGAWIAALPGTSFSDSTVTAGATYAYRVVARDYDGKPSSPAAVSVTAPLPIQTGSGITRGAVSTTVNATATAAVSIGVPAGTASGDLLVACIATNGGGVSGAGAPSGWSPLAIVTGLSNPKLFGYYHLATASEPAAYTWVLSSSVANAGGMAQYVGVDPVTTLDAPVSTTTVALTTTVTVPGVTTVTARTMLVGCVAANSSSSSLLIASPSGMTEAWDLSGKRTELADGIVDSPGATGPRTWSLSAARDAVGWLAALRAR